MQVKTKRAGLMLALALATSACATAYGEIGGFFEDGVTADRLSADTFRIRSRGNGMTEHGTIEDFALLRAAETMRMNCMTHFVVLDGADRTVVAETVTPAEWVETYEEKVIDGQKTRVETRTYRPESVSISIRPGQDLVVRGLAVPAGAEAPEAAIAADEVLTYVGTRVKRKKDAPPPLFPVCPEIAVAAR